MVSSVTLRRSLLYVPGDKEAMLAKAAGRGADCLVLNLEDAVAPAQKDLARAVVSRALATLDFGRAEVIVRINRPDSDAGYRDLLAVVPLRPAALLLPKVRSADEVRWVAWTLDRLEELHGLPIGGIRVMCMIESAAGVLAAREIAGCSSRVTALVFGAADYSEDVGCTVTADARALLPAMAQVVMAAHAVGIDAIDAPWMKLDDADGLLRSAQVARELGFDGKSAIHPAQIGPIHAVFSPSAEQVAWARRVVAVLTGGGETLGGAVLDGQFIEAPHLNRARRILAVAGLAGVPAEV